MTASSACGQIHEENQLLHPTTCCVPDFADSQYMAPTIHVTKTGKKKKAEFICKTFNKNRKEGVQAARSLGLSFRNCYEKLNIYKIIYLITPVTAINVYF